MGNPLYGLLLSRYFLKINFVDNLDNEIEEATFFSDQSLPIGSINSLTLVLLC